jgi:hypothetical protein
MIGIVERDDLTTLGRVARRLDSNVVGFGAPARENGVAQLPRSDTRYRHGQRGSSHARKMVIPEIESFK